MGYFLIHQEETTLWGFLSGGIGFELAIVLESLTGWGALLFIAFLFFVFNMYFFDITKIPAISKMGDYIIAFFEDIKETLLKRKDKEQDITSVLQQVKNEVEEEDNSKDESETWIVKKLPPRTTDKKRKIDPEFTINLPPVKEPEPIATVIEKTDIEVESIEVEKKEVLKDLSFEVEEKLKKRSQISK